MDGVPQTTFMPRKPMSDAAQMKRTGGGVFLTIGSIILVLSLLISGGLFFYGQVYLPQSLTAEQNALHTEAQQFSSSPLSAMVTLSNQLAAAKIVLGQHVALSTLFNFLAANTVASVRFVGFSYTTDNNIFTVGLTGVAASFSALNAEENQLENSNSILKNPTVSDVAVTKTGSVTFTITGTIPLSDILYQNTFSGGATASSTPS